MSYVLSLQPMYPFRDILRYFKRGTFFIVKLNFGDSSVAIIESEISLHAGQEKQLSLGQIIIAKVKGLVLSFHNDNPMLLT